MRLAPHRFGLLLTTMILPLPAFAGIGASLTIVENHDLGPMQIEVGSRAETPEPTPSLVIQNSSSSVVTARFHYSEHRVILAPHSRFSEPCSARTDDVVTLKLEQSNGAASLPLYLPCDGMLRIKDQ